MPSRVSFVTPKIWILQARIVEWVAIPFSKGSSWPRDRTRVSCVSCITGSFFSQVSYQGNPIFYLRRWFRRLFLSPECTCEALGNLIKVQNPTQCLWERACPDALTFSIVPCWSPAFPCSQLLELFSVYRFHYKVSPWRTSALFNVSAVHWYYCSYFTNKTESLEEVSGAQNHSLDFGDNDKAIPRASSLIPKLFAACHPHPRETAVTSHQAQGTLHRQQGGVVTQPGWDHLSPAHILPRQTGDALLGGGSFLDQALPWDPRVGGTVLTLPSPVWAHFPVHEQLPLPSCPPPLSHPSLLLLPGFISISPLKDSLHPRCCCCYSVPQSCPTLRLQGLACQVPLSLGFSRQESWRRLPFPLPGDLPDPGIEPVSPALAGGFFTTKPPSLISSVAFVSLLSLFRAS